MTLEYNRYPIVTIYMPLYKIFLSNLLTINGFELPDSFKTSAATICQVDLYRYNCTRFVISWMDLWTAHVPSAKHLCTVGRLVMHNCWIACGPLVDCLDTMDGSLVLRWWTGTVNGSWGVTQVGSKISKGYLIFPHFSLSFNKTLW